MDLKNEFVTVVKKLRETKPVVLHITNVVTAESCADVALAAGASPIMVNEAAEVDELAGRSDAVVLNLGTLTEAQREAMLVTARRAKGEKIPVVLDPAGVMCSQYRLNFALDLLQDGLIDIVRGNLSECGALLTGVADGRGLDNKTDFTKEQALKIAQEGSKKFSAVFAATGAVDYISDGKQAMMLNNGNPLLTDITGAGCMTSTLIGCCAAVAGNNFTAAALGILIMGQSAELAANFLEKKDGPGMFKARLMDGVYHITTKFDVLNL